eukprot:SM000012S25342  [mRNA]  locus=s12:473646:474524:- [translate_table: standard]
MLLLWDSQTLRTGTSSFHLVPSMYEWSGYNIYQSQLEYIAQKFDVIILNFGLHYNNRRVKGLRHDINSAADYLAKFNKKKGHIGFFREVLPQHFYTLNGNGIYPGPGDFPENVSQAIIKICHPAPRVHQASSARSSCKKATTHSPTDA